MRPVLHVCCRFCGCVFLLLAGSVCVRCLVAAVVKCCHLFWLVHLLTRELRSSFASQPKPRSPHRVVANKYKILPASVGRGGSSVGCCSHYSTLIYHNLRNYRTYTTHECLSVPEIHGQTPVCFGVEGGGVLRGIFPP